MKKRLLLFLFVSCLIGQLDLFAQAFEVTGTVTDATTGEVLPGVSIVIQGTTKGTTTNIDGKYSIEVPEAASVLQFSFIGYVSENVPVNGLKVVDMKLVSDIKKLDEVVVIGYGTAKKSELSASSISVSGEKLRGTVGATIDQALQGRAAGVTTVSTSGQPGAAASVVIRGKGTLNSNSEPLYVVDGVALQGVGESSQNVGLGDRLGNGSAPTFSSGLASINPSDIQSMEILKSAAATAIYGSRGSNGVVLITTKRGKTGDAKFTYEGQYAVQEQVSKLDIMNLREFAQYSSDWAAETSGRDPRVEFGDPSILGEGTNWQSELFRVAPMQNHQLSAQGGTEKIHYFVSGGYFKQDGTLIGTGFNKFNGRINLDAELKKWFKLGVNLSFVRSRDQLTLNNSTEGIISVAVRTTPDIPVRNSDGSWAGIYYEGAPSIINPIAKALDESNILKKSILNGGFYTDITFVKGLTLRTELSGNSDYSGAYQFTPTYKYGSLVNSTNTSSRQYNQGYFWQLHNYLTYTNTFGKHSVTGLIGQESWESIYENLRGTSNGLSSNDIQEPGLGDPSTMKVNSGDGSSAMSSIFSRVNYSYADRYYIYYTFRYDGSSNFGPENRWAPFHAVALSWRVSNEFFWEGLKNVVNDFKIRFDIGQTGNANIGGYRWGASITKMPSNLGMGFRQSNIANPYIQWEKQEQVNLGFDVSLFDSKINLVVELYKKTSKDMLMEMQLPSYMGTSGNASSKLNAPWGNFGSIENKGLEISLNLRPFSGKFKYETDFQISFNKNTLLGLTGTPSANIQGFGQWNDVVSLTTIGSSLYEFYGYKVAGVYQDKEDILNSPKPAAYPADGNFKRSTLWPGDLKFADISGPNGVPDGVINELDRTSIGSPQPKFTFGFNNAFSYKNFDLTIYLTGSVGNKVLNYVGRSLTLMDNMWSNMLATAVDRAKLEKIDPNKAYPFVNASGTTISNWFDDVDNVRVANSGTTVPRAVSGDPNGNNRISDRYIEDGSYLRFKSVRLAYSIPKQIINKVGVENLQVYVNIQNLWTITNYTGLDPEIGASQTSNNVFGLDNGRYPAPRIYTFGVNLNF
jgi:TonB-dependent starch-binding outer membrane protein SusC